MDGQSETLRRALEALAEVCGPLSVKPPQRRSSEADIPPTWSKHESYMADFQIWIQQRCAQRQRHEDWGSVGSLLVDFCEWSVNRGEVPCSRDTLEKLLDDAGFVIVNGMARGLVLKVDLQANVPATARGNRR
jgi:hypothetical protein